MSFLDSLNFNLGLLKANICTRVKNLSVIFDSQLKFDKQINLLESGFYAFKLYHLCNRKSAMMSW